MRIGNFRWKNNRESDILRGKTFENQEFKGIKIDTREFKEKKLQM